MRTSLATCLLLCPVLASAATFTVTKSTDSADGVCDADCSLREAVSAANAAPGEDLVRLKLTSYSLTLGEIPVTDSVDVRGLATSRSTISAGKLSRVFTIAPGILVEFDDLVIRDGLVRGQGAGIRAEGDLTLRRCTVEANRVLADDAGIVQGGGIWNSGMLRVNDSTIRGNVALDDATLTGGRGGGIYNLKPGQIYMYDSAVRENRTGLDDANGYGGGIYNSGGRARIDRSFFWKNDPGGGEGSAIANRLNGSVALFNSTLSNNGHDGAQGAFMNGSFQETESEQATYSKPIATIYNSTVTNNNGGGLYNSGKATLKNAFVAGNYLQDGNDRYYNLGDACRNDYGGVVAQTYSAVGQGWCPANVRIDDSQTFKTWLAHLAYYGGPTPMHKPLSTYLIDNGDPNYCPSLDQREVARPVQYYQYPPRCDIGAMEVQYGE